ncbi:glycoside hydrolase [Violaceomyces palustris]|uniref:Glycoside hydrolase n=1 Tax=Violaceomyces palustris TaxID=1673888 RepID=A0ACD0P603_9BASI|nr:glycoside hydrolase [Violaceomyces palustris]
MATLHLALIRGIKAQLINEVFSTTYDGSRSLEFSNPGIQFVSGPAVTSSINATSSHPDIIGISIFDNQVHQQMDAIGAGITDAAAIVLKDFKTNHPDQYWELLNMLFSQDPEWIVKGGAGLNACRSPLGASDFGISPYTYDDTYDGSTDEDLKLFTLDKAPKLFEVLQDVKSVNPNTKFTFATWSAPGWMKDSPNAQPLFQGSLKQGYEDIFAKYLYKSMATIKSEKGLQPYFLSIQNEPLYTSNSYPGMRVSPTSAGKIGASLRKLLDDGGLNSIKIMTYDHNWDNDQYAIQQSDSAPFDTFAGVAWHCYAGNPTAQQRYNQAYPGKEVHMTECTKITQYLSEPWPNLRSTLHDLIIGSIRYGSRSVLLWNVALKEDDDGFTTPHLPNVCTNCLAPILFNSNAFQSDPTASLKGTNTRTVAQAQADDAGSKKRKKRFFSKDSFGGHETAGSRRATLEKRQTSFYKTTSDYLALTHLSLAVRARGSSTYGVNINSITSDETALGDANSRLFSQVFRSDNADSRGNSRWSVVILNRNDHFLTGRYDNVTVAINFRGKVANFTCMPGVYTLSWLAPKTA